ncbi:hypothetical protein [Pleomorphovibrio marinus]|uniref:hypothetical protein n=1 Tax=Pleomorphovibrio marinus TaxID=2164132 RepID=UPI000E0C6DD9|nr:hypothetical protein [Pleomorphovibrio marinus]
MKTNALGLMAFLLILTGSLISCQDDISKEILVDDNQENSSLEVFSLYGTMCNWVNRENDGKVVIINSLEELEQYVSCSMNSSFHSLDFSKQSLLLVGSVASSGIYDIYKTSIQQSSIDDYELKVKIRLNEIPLPLEWDIAVRVDKLRDDAQVLLRVDELPGTITSVIGKWRLIKEYTSGFGSPQEEIDYSKRNIVYDFKNDGVLMVSGDGHTGWVKNGNHSYSIGNFRRIKVGYRSSWYSVSPNELIIDSRPADGSAFYFAKVK